MACDFSRQCFEIHHLTLKTCVMYKYAMKSSKIGHFTMIIQNGQKMEKLYQIKVYFTNLTYICYITSNYIPTKDALNN